jgi:YebC/PmpR family DNA-binding regulatory protein
MSGHNKWSTIKHKKGKEDARRGKIFTKLIREITTAARCGGGDADGNPRLRAAIQAAKQSNMPADNVIRAIKKGTGELEGASYEESMFEGYGPGGIAVIVETLTDNRNRTVAEVRHIFAKNGGNLGENNCVSWMFDNLGQIVVAEKRGDGSPVDEDEIMMAALDAGATDVKTEDESFVILTELSDLESVRQALETAGYTIEEAGLARVPQNTLQLEGKQAEQAVRLLEALEDSDDVQKVWANCDFDDSTLEAMG